MLEIFCALFPEAKPLIQHLNLKKDKNSSDFFCNENKTIRLTILGVGKVKAASKVALTLQDDNDPFVVSFGSSASLQNMNFDLYIANRITDIDTGFSYYPDLLFQTNLEECSFLCGSQLYSKEINPRASITPYINIQEYLESIIQKEPSYLLYDMESSSIYEVANQYIGPEKMFFIRYPSDTESKDITPTKITEQVESLYKKLDPVLQMILSLIEDTKVDQDILVQTFMDHIHASRSMQEQIKQIVSYCTNANIDYKKVIQEELKQDIKNKEDGKRVFHEFKKKCCEE